MGAILKRTFPDKSLDPETGLYYYGARYLGDTRIVTKLNSGENPTYQEESRKQYYYHSDHLGSASLISDYKGDEYQRLEYTPYGETWVEKTNNTGLEYLPYKFTAKELDEETGLYYYGARYLDPKYSMWLSTDPALGEYIPAVGKATIEEAGKLPGMGGLFNHVNHNLYHYAGNNPVKYKDPDGNALHVAVGAGIGVVAAVGAKVLGDIRTKTQSSFSDYISAAMGGATAGAVLAATGNGAAAGALGAAVADVSKSAMTIAGKTINDEKIDVKSELIDLAVDLAVDVPVGAIIGDKIGYGKIPRVTSGKGSFVSIANQMDTKVANGTIKNITAKTSAKMAFGRCVKGALFTGTVLGNEVVGRISQSPRQDVKDNLHDKTNASNE